MRDSEILRRAESEMEARRAENDRERNRRLQHAAALDPEIVRLSGEGARLFSQLARRLLENPETAQALSAHTRDAAAQARRELEERLQRQNLPSDYLENVWECPICKDTGTTGLGAERRRCGCFEKRIQRLLHENGSPLDRENFSTYDPMLIPDTPLPGSRFTQRELALKVRDKCLEYAKGYPGNERPMLVIYGGTGLGKTFLLHCIFAYLLDRGVDAQMVTAYQAFTSMRACHMGETDDFQRMVDAPVLLLDDLGAEPMMRNVTVEYLFTLINERVTARRHTVIATNLDDAALQERYGERLFSRLFDRQNGMALALQGKDLRLWGNGAGQ